MLLRRPQFDTTKETNKRAGYHAEGTDPSALKRYRKKRRPSIDSIGHSRATVPLFIRAILSNHGQYPGETTLAGEPLIEYTVGT